MLFELLATDMYISYNIKLAKIIGVLPAIYVSELININRKAIEKNKLKDNNYFKINREYIEERTTITKADQKDLDATLNSINLISIGETSDLLKVNMDVLTSLILGEQKIVTDITQPKQKRATKQEMVIRALRANVETTNSELKQAYEDWIDSVCAKQGWMTKIHVIEGQKVLNEYNKDKDLDLALTILKIATLGGYRDINWAINEFEKKHKKEFEKQFNSPVLNNNNNVNVQKPRLRMSNEVF